MEYLSSMKDFRAHCSELVQFFGSLADFRGYEGAEDVSSWLNLAACIESVNYDTSHFDPGAGCCGLADTRADNQARLQKKLVTEITRFQLCWTALEAAIDRFVSIENSPRGKIKKLCYFLKQNCRQNNVIGYSNLVAYIDNRKNDEASYSSVFRSVDDNYEFLSEHGCGIYSVYSLRNKLAHGAFDIPSSYDGENVKVLTDILVSSRIILLTLHFLMVAKYPHDSVEVFWKRHEILAVPFDVYLKSIHVDDLTYLHDIGYDFES